MLCNLALSFRESPANRKFQELNLFHTLDLFPLVSSEKMEIGAIITGSPPHPFGITGKQTRFFPISGIPKHNLMLFETELV